MGRNAQHEGCSDGMVSGCDADIGHGFGLGLVFREISEMATPSFYFRRGENRCRVGGEGVPRGSKKHTKESCEDFGTASACDGLRSPFSHAGPGNDTNGNVENAHRALIGIATYFLHFSLLILVTILVGWVQLISPFYI